MTLRISRRDVEDAYRYADRALQSARDLDKMSPNKQKLVRTGETLGAAAIVGVLSGRFGPLNIPGTQVPADLLVGIAGHLIGFFGLAGKWDDHVHNLADGVLMAYVTKFSVGVGTQMRAKAGLPAITVGGESNPFPAHGGMPYGTLAKSIPSDFQAATNEPLTEAELVSLSQNKEG